MPFLDILGQKLHAVADVPQMKFIDVIPPMKRDWRRLSRCIGNIFYRASFGLEDVNNFYDAKLVDNSSYTLKIIISSFEIEIH